MGTLGLEVDKGLYLGIDFGTTNSVVSIYQYDTSEVHTLTIDGSSIFPTAIQFDEDSENVGKLERIFGIQAKESAMIYPESTVLSVKRLLGSDEEVEITVNHQRYTFKSEQIVAEILAHLKSQADQFIQETLGIHGTFSGCVITVPANSTDKQKRKTKEAAMMAGFQEKLVFLRLEPAAAAIGYAVDVKDNKKVLVYDFGGGTFDACVLQIQTNESTLGTGTSTEIEPEIAILSTFGDNHLGGNDLDLLMVDYIYEAFLEQTNHLIDLFPQSEAAITQNLSEKHRKMAVMRLFQVANQAKEKLSQMQTTKVVLAPFLQEPEIINLQVEISQEQYLNHKRMHMLNDSPTVFEKMKERSAKMLIAQTITCIEKCLRAAKLQPADIDEIFLVGGSSAIPEVRRQIQATFAKEPYTSKLSPALGIAVGAAYYCNQIMLPNRLGPRIQEVTIHPLGLEISGRRFMEIVPKGMIIPKEGLEIESEALLETNYDDMTQMVITVYEDTMKEEDRLRFVYEDGMKRLSGTSLRGIPPKAKGEEKVQVFFSVGQDNMLSVNAKSTSEDGVETTLIVDALY